MGWKTPATYSGSFSIPGLPGAALNGGNGVPELLLTWIGPGNALAYQANLPIIGSANLSPSTTFPGGFTSGSPAAAITPSNMCYFFWRGLAPDDHIYWGWLDLGTQSVTPGTQYPGGASADGPVVVYSMDGNPRLSQGLIAAWRGSQYADSQELFITTIAQAEGSPIATSTYPMTLSGAINGLYSPSLAVSPEGAVFAAWAGAQGDLSIYYSVTVDPTSSTFSPPTPIASVQTSDRVSLTIVRNRLVLVFRTPDNFLMFMTGTYNSSFGVSWSAPTEVPGVGMAVPAGVWATSPVPQDTAYYAVGDRQADGLITDTVLLLSYTPD